MKKYWLLLVALIIVCASIGTYYTKRAQAVENISVSFETLSGDTSYLDDIYFEGYLANSTYYKGFTISNKETTVIPSKIAAQVDEVYFNKLVDAHKGFMRGKEYNSSNYFESDELLTYVNYATANTSYAAGEKIPFTVDSLNKETNARQTFTIEWAVEVGLYSVLIDHIQIQNDMLEVYIRSSSSEYNEQANVMMIDLKTEKLVSVTKLAETKHDERFDYNLSFVNNEPGLRPYIGYVSSKFDSNSPDYKELDRKAIIYNTKAKQLKEIELDDSAIIDVDLLTTDYFVQVERDDQQINIQQFDLQTEKWLPTTTFDYPIAAKNYEYSHTGVVDGNIFLTTTTAKDGMIQIYDPKKQQVVYESLITGSIGRSQSGLMLIDAYKAQ